MSVAVPHFIWLQSSYIQDGSTLADPPGICGQGVVQSLTFFAMSFPSQSHSVLYASSGEFDPHHYTSGRWLRNDQKEREMRYIEFDFDALCVRILALCPGAGSISDCEKIEGGFNRVFIFTLDNSQRIVARQPFTLAGPSHIIMEHAEGVQLHKKWPEMAGDERYEA
ncbi:Hypothetical protein PENO1_022810 [Penicillium occitanis (nom. inval.)]|nr:hypothetical protein PENOC_065470 [Penicillium occitanis (nom. inval.)]PCH05394.1 Hypothetical protein PENO1_022810 [Penicillium occitanis (nom. inval.)]